MKTPLRSTTTTSRTLLTQRRRGEKATPQSNRTTPSKRTTPAGRRRKRLEAADRRQHGGAHVQATATNSNRTKGQGDSGRVGSAHRSSIPFPPPAGRLRRVTTMDEMRSARCGMPAGIIEDIPADPVPSPLASLRRQTPHLRTKQDPAEISMVSPEFRQFLPT